MPGTSQAEHESAGFPSTLSTSRDEDSMNKEESHEPPWPSLEELCDKDMIEIDVTQLLLIDRKTDLRINPELAVSVPILPSNLCM